MLFILAPPAADLQLSTGKQSALLSCQAGPLCESLQAPLPRSHLYQCYAYSYSSGFLYYDATEFDMRAADLQLCGQPQCPDELRSSTYVEVNAFLRCQRGRC